MKDFIPQRHGFSCFPVAASNACIWSGIKPPHIEMLIDIACCRHGGTIHEEKVLEATKLQWHKTNDDEVLAQQGIICINHPKWNFHAVFVYNDENGLWLVNSGLTDKLVDQAKFELPKWEHQRRAWLLRKGWWMCP